MARAGKVDIPPNTITELTNADVAGKITFQNLSSSVATVVGTDTATAPAVADFDGGLVVPFFDGPAGLTLEDIFPGAGYTRLWVYSRGGGVFAVYHA